MPTQLSKGARINLTEAAPGLEELSLVCDWTRLATKSFNVNLVACMLDASSRVPSQQFVVLANKSSQSAVSIMPFDSPATQAQGVATVHLTKIPSAIERISIILTVGDATAGEVCFSDLSNVKLRLLDGKSRNEIAFFELDDESADCSAVILGDFYIKNGAWRFSAVGSGFKDGLTALAQKYGASIGLANVVNSTFAAESTFASSQKNTAAEPPHSGSALQSQASKPVKCHEIDYEILGYESQIVEVELDPNETVVAEAGAMNYMQSGIHYEAKMGDGSSLKSGFLEGLLSVGRRLVTGESIMMTHFTNQSAVKKRVAFAAPYPGSIVALDMMALGGKILCQKDAFLAAALGTEISLAFNRKLGVGFFGGEGFILQSIKGDGLAFIHAGGSVVEKQLQNETLYVDTGCLVAFTGGIDYDIKMVKGLKSMFFGGEGLFLATLSGTGKVWLQSAPFSRFADRVLASAPSAGGSSQGEGSVLGGLGRLLGGD